MMRQLQRWSPNPEHVNLYIYDSVLGLLQDENLRESLSAEVCAEASAVLWEVILETKPTATRQFCSSGKWRHSVA